MSKTKLAANNKYKIGLIQIRLGQNQNDNLKKAVTLDERAAKMVLM